VAALTRALAGLHYWYRVDWNLTIVDWFRLYKQLLMSPVQQLLRGNTHEATR